MLPGVKEVKATSLLAVGVDELSLCRIRASLSGTSLKLRAVSWEDALDSAGEADGPLVLLIEWSASEHDAILKMCDALRVAASPHRCHFIAVGTLTEEGALARAVDGVFDDVLTRPFGRDLELRLRQAAHAAQSPGSSQSPRSVLAEALKSPVGGEVVVRSRTVTGAIHVLNGQVVWAHVSSAPPSIEEVLAHAGVTVEPEVADAVKLECRNTGAHFVDVLTQWGVVGASEAREALRVFVAGRVKAALELPDAVGLFLPRARKGSRREGFSASEIPALSFLVDEAPTLPCSGRAPVTRAAPHELSSAQIESFLQEALATNGAVAAAIFHRPSGASLASCGRELDMGIALSQLATLTALGSAASDVIAAGDERCFITRPLACDASLALFVELSLPETTIGLARSTIARIASRQVSADTAENG
ncbi:MAG: hypothetical protein R3B70_04550 [Polyangiaceae bacterium]